MYFSGLSRGFRTLSPALQGFRRLEPEVWNGVWDSGIPDFFPDLVHLCKVFVLSLRSHMGSEPILQTLQRDATREEI